ncbi:hypothetical protein [Halorussus caseinilyticus]|uniref:Preprotein translocase subunit SecG n=1 Tax=Halorussus caseinilyticus TaxID=3034025 RepID=A0ABD5WIB6_9EURY|nr:hypothetical protein [Halorussus sp. DT72]
MVIGLSGGGGGASRPSVSQNSNEGIGGGGGSMKGILVLATLLAIFFALLVLFG